MKKPSKHTKKPTVAEIARRLGVDPRTAKKLLADRDIDLATATTPEVIAAAAAAGDQKAQLLAVKIRNLSADADIRETRAAALKRHLIPADEIRVTITRLILAAKSKTFGAIKTAANEAGLKLGLDGDAIGAIVETFDRRLVDCWAELSRCEWAQGPTLCERCGGPTVNPDR